MADYAPTPWTFEVYYDHQDRRVKRVMDAGGCMLFEINTDWERPDLADRIVRAVNTHDQLVAACAQALTVHLLRDHLLTDCCEDTCANARELRAALAAAKGESLCHPE